MRKGGEEKERERQTDRETEGLEQLGRMIEKVVRRISIRKRRAQGMRSRKWLGVLEMLTERNGRRTVIHIHTTYVFLFLVYSNAPQEVVDPLIYEGFVEELVEVLEIRDNSGELVVSNANLFDFGKEF